MNRCAIVLAALLAVRAPRSVLQAQYSVPVALVPGYQETPDKFWDLGAQLYSAFYPRVIDVYPSLATSESITRQADQLRSMLGSFATTTLAVGHSDGGLVARTMAGGRRGGGPRAIITYGTPNAGVPALQHFSDAWWFYTFLGWDLEGVAITAGDLFAYNRGLGGSVLVALAVAGAAAAVEGVPDLVTRFLDAHAPSKAIFDDVKPGSPLLSWLNNNPATGIADADVPARIGFRVKTRENSVGGPLRLALSPSVASYFGYAMYFLGSSAMIAGSNLFDDTIYDDNLQWGDPGRYDRQLDLATALMAFGGQALLADTQWCWWVTGAYACPPNDAFIPTDRQYYSWSGGDDNRGIEILSSHVDEPSDKDMKNEIQNQVARVINRWYPY